VSQQSAAEQRADLLEAEWRESVKETLEELKNGQDSLVSAFHQNQIQNSIEHGQVTEKMSVMQAEGKVREEALLRIITDQNKKLESKNKLIRGLVLAVIALLSFIGGVQAKAYGLIKAIGF